MPRLLALPLLLVALAAVVLPATAAPAPDRTLATVGTLVVPASQYKHWGKIEHKSEPHASSSARRKATMQFLLSSDWIRGEAAEQGIKVTSKQVDKEFAKSKHQAFKTEKAFQRFLKQTGQTVADIKYRTRIDMLSARIQKAGIPDDFETKWKSRTLCAADYTVTDYCGGTLTPATSG